MSVWQMTYPRYKHYAKIALLKALFIISQFAKQKNIAKGTTDPGVDYFDQ